MLAHHLDRAALARELCCRTYAPSRARGNGAGALGWRRCRAVCLKQHHALVAAPRASKC